MAGVSTPGPWPPQSVSVSPEIGDLMCDLHPGDLFVHCTWFDGQPFLCKARSFRAQKTTVDSEMDESLGRHSTAQTPSPSTRHDDSPFCQECVRLTDTFTKLHMFSTTSCTVKHSLLTHNPILKMRISNSQTRKLKNPGSQKRLQRNVSAHRATPPTTHTS